MQPSYLKQLLSSSELNRIGRIYRFCQRLRDIQPARLLPALLSGLGCDKVDGIAGLHRHFNALQLHDTDQIAYKPFHNQLRKQGFPLFMRALVERTIALRLKSVYRTPTDWQALSRYCCRTGRHSRYIRNWQNISRADSISTARCGRVSYDHVLAGPVADIDEYHGGYRIGAQASSGRKFVK